MSEPRSISARELTRSSIGSVVEYFDIFEQPHKVRITDVKYDGTSSTVISYTDVAVLPNMLEVKVYD